MCRKQFRSFVMSCSLRDLTTHTFLSLHTNNVIYGRSFLNFCHRIKLILIVNYYVNQLENQDWLRKSNRKMRSLETSFLKKETKRDQTRTKKRSIGNKSKKNIF